MTASAQQQLNEGTARTQARLNRVNETDASGTVTYRDLGAEWKQKQLAEIEAKDWSGQANTLTAGTGSGLLGALPTSKSAKQTAIDALDKNNPYLDQWVKETKLSDDQQRLYDINEQTDLDIAGVKNTLVGQLGRTLGTDVDTSKLVGWQNLDYGGIQGPEWVSRDGMQGVRTGIGGAGEGIQRTLGDTDFEASRQRVEEAMLARLAPQQARDRAAFDAKMAVQGVSQGSQAYGAGADELNRSVNDARLSAVLAGGQEQSRLFGLAKDAADFQNTAQSLAFAQRQAEAAFGNEAQAQEFGQRTDLAAQHNAIRSDAIKERQDVANFRNNLRANQLSETLQLRSQPINEIASLFGLGQVQTPGTKNGGGGSGGGVGVQAADLQSAVTASDSRKAQAVASNNAASAQTAAAAATAVGSIAVAI